MPIPLGKATFNEGKEAERDMLQRTQFSRKQEIQKGPTKRTEGQSAEKVEIVRQEYVRKYFLAAMKILKTIKPVT